MGMGFRDGRGYAKSKGNMIEDGAKAEGQGGVREGCVDEGVVQASESGNNPLVGPGEETVKQGEFDQGESVNQVVEKGSEVMVKASGGVLIDRIPSEV
jgi:hypothetical protein